MVWHMAVFIDTFLKSANCFPMMQIALSAWRTCVYVYGDSFSLSLPSDTTSQTASCKLQGLQAEWLGKQFGQSNKPKSRLTDWLTDWLRHVDGFHFQVSKMPAIWAWLSGTRLVNEAIIKMHFAIAMPGRVHNALTCKTPRCSAQLNEHTSP